MFFNKERAREVLKREDLDAVITTNPRNIYYFTNFPILHECTTQPTMYAVIPADESIEPFMINRVANIPIHEASDCWITNIRFYAKPFVNIPEALKPEDLTTEERRMLELVRSGEYKETPTEALVSALGEYKLSTGRLGFDEEHLLKPSIMEEVKRALPNAEMLPASDIIRQIRTVKTEEELRIMKKAAEINEKGILAMINSMKEGVAEEELAEIHRTAIWEAGGIPHFCNVGFGTRSSIPTKPPGKYQLKKGDLVKFDMDCIHKHYFSDIGRTAVLGKADEKLKKYYNAVYSGLQAAEEKVKPGEKPSEVFKTSIEAVRKSGIPYYSITYIGHTMGLFCYDGLLIHPMENRPLEEGMVINLEPTHYELGLGCFHAEDTVVVTKDGCKSLQEVSFELFEV
jgi:Xaa-Pro dipeptidase